MAAAFDLVQGEGLVALTMRGLADRLGVKTASLYWHIRDQRELVDLLAQTLLGEVRLPRPTREWRDDALAACSAFERVVRRRRDAPRLLLEAIDVLERSDVHARLRDVLRSAGLADDTAHQTATLMLVYVLTAATPNVATPPRSARAPQPVTVAIDTGSRGVCLRAGPEMSSLIRVATDPTAAAPALIHGDTVVVRRLRGAGQGELELNPGRPWAFKIQAPTWNTLLNLVGVDVREIHIDSGATRVECILPPPHGMVPIKVSGGVVGVRLRRPPGVKVIADVSPGALQLRLDDVSFGVAKSNLRWESAGPAAADYYLLTISGGAVRVALEEDASIPSEVRRRTDASLRPSVTPLELLLDGVDRQGRASRR